MNRAQQKARRRRQKNARREMVTRLALLGLWVDELCLRLLQQRLQEFLRNMRVKEKTKGKVLITSHITLPATTYISIDMVV